MKRGLQVASVLAVCLIVVLSIIPGDMQIRTGAPKTFEHLVAYLLSGLMLAQAFGGCRRAPIVIAFLVAMAGTLELFQHWVPGRTFDYKDWEASSVGSMVGVALAHVLDRTTMKHHNSSPANAGPDLQPQDDSIGTRDTA